jgi:hypothetical protein
MLIFRDVFAVENRVMETFLIDFGLCHSFYSNFIYGLRLGRNFVVQRAGQISAGGSRSRWNVPAVWWQLATS